ncbi:PhoH family protein [Lentilactobacillus sp. SPB1-3]|uniref:PhoH family protein n=1 Tax=Lentilactobacillus terminaliae TaxID=3003483 RepID=A0ACD5DCQ0_9LACO|nr:PhoH family protein [Lentilactobacillus sp. SPB1-3]MCZ0977278.1 PhoH family protein [Lentilactobacillus sp. SPB1-3]
MAEEQVTTKEFIVAEQNNLLTIVGAQDEYISILESGLNVSINVFGNSLKVSGEEAAVDTTLLILKNILGLIEKGISINSSDFVSALNMAENGTLEYFSDLYDQVLIKDAKNHAVRVKTFGQRQYVQAIRNHDIVFGVGPAGTGKTYLAVVMAVSALKKGIVDRIVLTRPAVEAGESLGFLPGDLKDKVDPYLRPIYDALHAILGTEHTERLLERGIIEIAPLAYMRGRTLDNAFVILDEAQNTTNSQMKMFLTRLGFGSKMIVNGDISQIDLPRNARSGLVAAQKILANIDQIEFVNFSSKDVVRHPVVSKIINAYEDNAG